MSIEVRLSEKAVAVLRAGRRISLQLPATAERPAVEVGLQWIVDSQADAVAAPDRLPSLEPGVEHALP